MEIKVKNLNKNEYYACGEKDVRKVFSQQDAIHIGFGYLGRNYCFDTSWTKHSHPQVDGVIIADLEINRRLDVEESSPMLNFYVMKDSKCNDENRETFRKSVLPRINEWYQKTLSQKDNADFGVKALLVEWTGEDFRLHDCNYF